MPRRGRHDPVRVDTSAGVVGVLSDLVENALANMKAVDREDVEIRGLLERARRDLQAAGPRDA